MVQEGDAKTMLWAVPVLGEEGDAEAVLPCRSDEVRMPVKKQEGGSVHQPGSRSMNPVEFERSPVSARRKVGQVALIFELLGCQAASLGMVRSN